MTGRDALEVWWPYCAASPGRSCRTRPAREWSKRAAQHELPGGETAPHADRRRVARDELPEMVPVDTPHRVG